MDQRELDIHTLDPAMQEILAECEISGQRTVFARNGRPIAALVSWDEYLALKETIEIGANAELRAELEQAEAGARRGELMLPEDLFVE
ncbi:MAG TPA: type II toxin-antitoxin system Phd/YefM family antitoxin [Thermoanaerobaculia bacterium]|nr:type II toxin-antitoxin system Phd/YefM family antitoxin [Thermoanaerobaculia bacterium]